MTRSEARLETADASAAGGGPRAVLLHSRDVPLGGVRAMEVRRALPHRDLPMVGAWCFLDRFGPQVARMRVEPHPHIGLQTVTWPFVGEVRHRDTVGSDVLVSRGALNLMTSGAGIAHSEYSVGEDAVPLDALQLWVALPEHRRHGPQAFERHENLPTVALTSPDGAAAGAATVVVGPYCGAVSPASTYTPLLGVEVRLVPGATARLPLERGWEHALAGVFDDAGVHASVTDDAGGSSASPTLVAAHDLLYLGDGRDHVDVTAGAEGATLFLLGGQRFADEIVMWWNFVGRTHEEIVAAREDWEADSPRFGHVVGHGAERVPAPPLPSVRLTPRRRRP